MVYPHATSEAGARRPAIIQLEQFKEASSKPAQLYAFRLREFLWPHGASFRELPIVALYSMSNMMVVGPGKKPRGSRVFYNQISSATFPNVEFAMKFKDQTKTTALYGEQR
jgi:hypothetical protein